MPANNLAVKVHLNNRSAKAQQNREYEVLWGRVATVSALACGILAMIFLGVRHWGAQTPTANGSDERPSLTAPPRVSSPAEAPLTTAERVQVDTDSNPRASGQNEQGTTSGPADVPRVEIAPSAANGNLTTTTEVPAVAADPPTRPHPNQQPALAPAQARESGSPELAKIQVRSDHIGFSALSATRLQREPGPPLPAVVTMDGRELITVYLFTRYDNLEQQFIYHDWFLKGERIARVKAQAHAPTWNVYSSKFINRQMAGPWRVEVRTAKGDLLATAGFEVQP